MTRATALCTKRGGDAALAIVLLALAGASGGRTHRGTFGVTDVALDCVSVWQLPWQDHLNAATCIADLRHHVTRTAVLLGAAGGTAGLELRPHRARWLLPAGAVMAGAFIATGRHFIWSVTGA